MRRNRENIEYDKDEPHLADIRLISLSENGGDSGAVLYNRVKGRRTESLGSSGNYRLFFLLKGRVHLYSGEYDKYLMHRKEFILLPAGVSITCRIEEDSRYVVLNCTELKSKGNVTYFERLRKRRCVQTPFVIQNEVKNLLQNHATASIEILRFALDDRNMGFDTPPISCFTLPIRDRLSEVLSSFAAYPAEKNQHQAIYDAVFILLRLLYTEEELLLMVHPMLQERNTHAQMTET